MDIDKHIEQNFKRFFITKFPIVKNFARMLLKSEEDAEDVAQDIFLKLWSNPELWFEKEDVDGYIYQMTKNAVLNRIRHLHVEQTYQQSAAMDNFLKDIADGEENDALNSLYYKEVILLVQLTLEQLPPKRRDIFRLSRFQHLSNKEIAEKLNLSVRTVEHQIYLALSELKKKIFLFFI